MRKEIEIHGLTVSFDSVPESFEGDPTVPNGTRKIPAYAADIEVIAPDGMDITDWLNSRAMDRLAEIIEEDYL